jgi:hypothetical protein
LNGDLEAFLAGGLEVSAAGKEGPLRIRTRRRRILPVIGFNASSVSIKPGAVNQLASSSLVAPKKKGQGEHDFQERGIYPD